MSDIKRTSKNEYFTILKISIPLLIALAIVVVVNVVAALFGHDEGAPEWLNTFILLGGLLFTMLNFISAIFTRTAENW